MTQTFHVVRDGIVNHRHRFLKRLAVAETARQRWNRDRVTALRLPAELQHDTIADDMKGRVHHAEIIPRTRFR